MQAAGDGVIECAHQNIADPAEKTGENSRPLSMQGRCDFLAICCFARHELTHLGCEACVLDPQHQFQRSEEHTSELQSLMRISYAVFCLKKKKQTETQY